MIFQDAGGGLDCHALKALRIQQPACYLCPSNSALGTDLRILGKVEFIPLCVPNRNIKKRIVRFSPNQRLNPRFDQGLGRWLLSERFALSSGVTSRRWFASRPTGTQGQLLDPKSGTSGLETLGLRNLGL